MHKYRFNEFVISFGNASKRCTIYTKIINPVISAFIISENLSTLKAQPGPKYTTPIRTEFSRDSPDRGPDTLGYLTKTWGTFCVYIFFILPPKKGKTRKNPALGGFLPARSARKVCTFADRREFFADFFPSII